MGRTTSTARRDCVWIPSRVRHVIWTAIQLSFRVTRGQRNSLSGHLAQGRRGAHAAQRQEQPLTEEEVALLSEWIKQGAKYDKHWSYKQTVRREVPSNVHPVDHFIRKRLQAEGVKPSAKADRRTLARRVSLDLIGLPPKLDEVKAFEADKEPNAYEKFVARLLARPEFGEHWARMWLDLARYADSAGYADDPPRSI